MTTPLAHGDVRRPHPADRDDRLTGRAARTVSDIVTVTADAADNVGVAGVQFSVDGVVTGVEDTTDPYALAWDTRTSPNGVTHADRHEPATRPATQRCLGLA